MVVSDRIPRIETDGVVCPQPGAVGSDPNSLGYSGPGMVVSDQNKPQDLDFEKLMENIAEAICRN